MSSKYVVHSSGGDLYGPFDTVEEAVAWEQENEEIVGDSYVQEVYSASWPAN